jgi:hypothetical protein
VPDTFTRRQTYDDEHFLTGKKAMAGIFIEKRLSDARAGL